MINMTKLSISSLSLLAAMLVFSGCEKSDPIAPPTGGNDKIEFVANSEAKFEVYMLDTAQSAQNQRMANADTMHQTTLEGKAELEGKSATRRGNQYQRSNLADTVHVFQDANGDLYMYDFGLDLLNKDPVMQMGLGNQQVHFGWVLVSKMSASSGSTWLAADTSVTVNLGGLDINARILDNASTMSDTTFMLGTTSYAASRARHVITADIGGSVVASTVFEVTIVPELGGIVRSVRKVTELNMPNLPYKNAIGQEFMLTAYTKP